MVFTIEASNQHGTQTLVAKSGQEAVAIIADLLNDECQIDRVVDQHGNVVSYDTIIADNNRTARL